MFKKRKNFRLCDVKFFFKDGTSTIRTYPFSVVQKAKIQKQLNNGKVSFVCCGNFAVAKDSLKILEIVDHVGVHSVHG